MTPKLRVRAKVAIAVIASLGATLIVIWVDELRFAYRNEVLKVALETSSSLVAALGSFLLAGRFRVRRLFSDLLVAYGLGVLSLANMLLVLLPSALSRGSIALRVATWTPLSFHIMGAVALAAAASRIAERRVDGKEVPRLVVAGLGAPFLLAGIALAARLPADTTRQLPLALALHPQFGREPFVAVVQGIGAVVMFAAVVGFVRRAERDADRLSEWLALGCALSAVARVNFALFPSLFSRWLYTGDVVRLGGYGCWLVGAAIEIASYWEGRTATAVAEERRRLARDLHDGLAQELAFVAAELRSGPQSDRQYLLVSAAERALDESRRAIDSLASDSEASLSALLQRTCDAMSERHDVAISLVGDIDPVVSADTREQLVRIVREAVVNACRHGNARHVTMSMTLNHGIASVVVRDDGRGFDTSAGVPSSRFGLQSMHERAESIGAELVVASVVGSGTSVEVSWEAMA